MINVKLLRGKAFVKFSSADALTKCIELNGTESEGRRLRIDEAGAEKAPTVRDPESTTIFVGGISYFSNEAALEEAFKVCGEIKDIRMPLNEE